MNDPVLISLGSLIVLTFSLLACGLLMYGLWAARNRLREAKARAAEHRHDARILSVKHPSEHHTSVLTGCSCGEIRTRGVMVLPGHWTLEELEGRIRVAQLDLSALRRIAGLETQNLGDKDREL